MWHTSNANTERRKKEIEDIFEAIMTDNFPKLMTDTKPHTQEAQRIPSSINIKNLYQGIWYLNCRKTKTKEKLLKEERKEHLTNREARIKITSDSSLETIQARK